MKRIPFPLRLFPTLVACFDLGVSDAGSKTSFRTRAGETDIVGQPRSVGSQPLSGTK